MENEIYKDQENKTVFCHVNERTKPLFKEMLNKIGDEVKIGKSSLKFGDAIYKLDEEEFISLFNRWVTACVEKNIMRKTLSSDYTKKLEWSKELSDVERAWLSMEVLKEIL